MEKLDQLPLPPSITISSDCLLGKSHNRIFSRGKQNLPSQSHIPPKPTSGNLFVSQETLSDKFSIGSFFRVLTKLSNLKVLSLVSIGLWGQLPAMINRLKSLEKLNISSNFISGEIPGSISVLTNLTSLVLADNLFNGSVPDMKSLQSLQEIDLSINRLGPEFPSMSTNLATIKLKNNSLRSGIPSQIKGFDLLQRFDVSGNKLVGPIPSPLFSLPSIQYLNLDDNQFNGALSLNLSCSVNLTFVDISSNFLIGKLPACIGSNATNRTVLSSWNCLTSGGLEYQHPYSFCQKEALAVIPPNTNREGQSKGKRYFGGVVGAVFAVGLLILIIFRREKKKKKKKDDSFECDSFVLEKSSVRSEPAIDGRHVPQTMTMGLPPYHVFTLEEMEDATNNFDPSNLAGEGSQGQLYRGWLRDDLIFLVKCLKLKQKHSQQSLPQHMEVISKLRHRHLVSVLGHYIVTYQNHHPNAASTVFIILEHVANGSLRDHLTDWIKREYLKWPQRRRIAVGIARGIQFLHSGMYGNDLKIENILLDKTLTAKISSSTFHCHPREIINRLIPPKSAVIRRLLCLLNHRSPPLLRLQFLRNLGVFLVEIEHRRAVVLLGGGGGSSEVSIDHGVDAGLAESEGALSGRFDDNGDLSAAEDAELTGLLEEAGTAFREGDLAIAYALNLLDFDLPAALGGCLGGVHGDHARERVVCLERKLMGESCWKESGSESPLNGQDNPNRLSSTESAKKNDIYQLGVILLEVISGKPITSETQLAELKLQLERGLAESPLRLREAIDPSIRGTFSHESLKTAVKITMKCLSKDSISHPTIEDVLWHMQYSIQVQEGWTSSGNLSTKV
ncbi:unnamed protein product [Camellia sinensis]